MANTIGNNIKVTVEGQSHSEFIDVKIEGLPAGLNIDMESIQAFLNRRQGGNSRYTTPRKEKDEPVIESGVVDGKTDGQMLEAKFYNSNVRSGDYSNLRTVPRPSHADYVAYVKYEGKADMRGGGQFSGRLTLPICFAGAICIDALKEQGITIESKIVSVGTLKLYENGVKIPGAEEKMEEYLTAIAVDGDSTGGVIECTVNGLPVGVGDPLYDSLESKLAHAIFGIPAVKGIEFGAGFGITEMLGSVANDPFIIKDGKITCGSNNSGGIQGGISNGMPVVFRVAIKPTPSISKPQRSVDITTMEETELVIKGRHDSCIVPRALPGVEAMAAICLYDALLGD